MDKSPDAFRTIREVAESMDLPQHVLRFWETRFPQIKPLKRGGGRRYYRPDDVELLKAIKHLLYGEGYTIKGVQKLIKEQGARSVAAGAPNLLSGQMAFGDMPPPADEAYGQLDADEQFGDREPAPARIKPEARDEHSTSLKNRAALSPEDVLALRAALQDIVEGERILSLARAHTPS
jgi:DNA-binding transcriptional MerR regulator